MDEAAGTESFEERGVGYGEFGEALRDAAVEDTGAEPGGGLSGDVSEVLCGKGEGGGGFGVAHAGSAVTAAAVVAEAVFPVSDVFRVCHCAMSDIK